MCNVDSFFFKCCLPVVACLEDIGVGQEGTQGTAGVSQPIFSLVRTAWVGKEGPVPPLLSPLLSPSLKTKVVPRVEMTLQVALLATNPAKLTITRILIGQR